MSRPSTLPQKRSREDETKAPQLPEPEKKLYELIISRKDMGIWTADMKKETGVQNDSALKKALKQLEGKGLIKLVPSVRNKSRKIYMGVDFQPSKEISGGSWYTNGNLDKEFIDILKKICLHEIEKLKAATIDDLSKCIANTHISNVEVSNQQIVEIVRLLLLDDEVEEVRSTGEGEFSRVRAKSVCYRSLRGRGGQKGYLASIPCGVCPRISECTPDGVISPKTCVYYNSWLNLEF